MLEGYPVPCSGGGGLSSLNVLRAHLDTTSVSLKKPEKYHHRIHLNGITVIITIDHNTI